MSEENPDQNKNVIRRVGKGVLAFLGLITLNSALYTVNQREQAVITQFGKPVKVILNPIEDSDEEAAQLREQYGSKGIATSVGAGLYTKVPFFQTVNRFDRRLLEWDGFPEEVPTRDKKYIWVDTTARWAIQDPVKFLESVKTEEQAQARIDDIIDGTVRNIITGKNLIEVVRSSNRKMEVTEKELEETVKVDQIQYGREVIMGEMNEAAQSALREYGIKLHGSGITIKRIAYVDAVKEQIEQRMISERKSIADRIRSEGNAEYEKILGLKEKDEREIISGGYKRAREVEGDADKQAIEIFAKAYQRDSRFYQFMKSLEVLQERIEKDARFIIGTDSDLFKYLKHGKK